MSIAAATTAETAADISQENLSLLDLVVERDRQYLAEPELIFPFFLRPCVVKVLLVTDGGLDFGLGGFGLRTFVESLLTMPGYYVRFSITVAHIDNVSDAQVMVGHPGIARSIKQFKFDNTSHFTPTMYDQVWLFGISTFYSRGAGYPSNALSSNELTALHQFMDGGGGLFATGDHGYLGVCLSGSVKRARSMRLWGDTSTNNNTNEVSMSGQRRNDTNRLGHDTISTFDDQSDDVPQPIQPKLYTRWWGWWRYTYPHPLLCGPLGVIRVLPDHPHEGECVLPNLSNSTTNAEYPTPGFGPRPLPEIIATSTVLSGSTAGFKDPTQPHSFGAICAYDGHRASVGRVVTDATWHHFVNINLTGDAGAPPGDPKRFGFLASAAGIAHLENIKSYYRNIAVWLSRPANITCMNIRLLWGLLWHERVMEAVMTAPEIALADASPRLLFDIGRHARDVLGRFAGQCQSRRLILWLVSDAVSYNLLERLDPWMPIASDEAAEEEATAEQEGVNWFDLDPVLDVALGAALVAIREDVGTPSDDTVENADEIVAAAVGRGVESAVATASESMARANERVAGLFG